MNVGKTFFGDAIAVPGSLLAPLLRIPFRRITLQLNVLLQEYREAMTLALAIAFRRHGIVQDPKAKAL